MNMLRISRAKSELGLNIDNCEFRWTSFARLIELKFKYSVYLSLFTSVVSVIGEERALMDKGN